MQAISYQYSDRGSRLPASVPQKRPYARRASLRRPQQPVDSNFSVTLPRMHGRQWRVDSGPAGQRLTCVENKSIAPTNEEIIAVAAPIFLSLLAAMAMIPLMI
jgi:hypothetical protein